MIAFKRYQRTIRLTNFVEAAPWRPGFDMARVWISNFDREAGSPKAGDMILRDPNYSDGLWLLSATHFAANFEEAVGDARERVAAAIDAAEPGHSLHLIRLVDDISTYELVVAGQRTEWPDLDSAYAEMRRVKMLAKADAAIAAFLGASLEDAS